MTPEEVTTQDEIEVEYLDKHANVEYIEDTNEKEEFEEDAFHDGQISTASRCD